MRIFLCLLTLVFSFSTFAQTAPVETTFTNKVNLKNTTLVGLESLNSFFYIKNNALHKKKENQTISYSNIQLGNIYSAHVFNPLKINVFYKDLNTVIILDNRLAEISKIDFNAIQSYKNVTKVSTGPDNTIWIFNQDTQQLELYDYKNNITRAVTRPVSNTPLDLKSNYNYCYLLTKKHIYIYNYFGSLVNKYDNTGYTSIQEYNDNLIIKDDKKLYFLNSNSKSISPINTPYFLINQFFVTNKSLYLYNNESLQEFHLKI